MKDFLIESGIEFDSSGKIKIPAWVKRVKLDIGLSDGAPQAAKWLEQESDLLVFGFEPNNNNIKNIRSRNSEWSTTLHPKHINKRFYLIECALANVQDMFQKKFYYTKLDPGCSSLLKPKEFEISEEVSVQTWSLNHFFDLFPFETIPFIDFIKTDCQGSDIDVLKGCSRYLNKIAIYTCEADDTRYHESTNTIQNLSNEFSKHNFFLYKNYMKKTTKFLRPRLKYIDTEDPTFVNRSLREEIEKYKIKAYQKG